MFWDNRTRSLEAQSLEPIKAFEEAFGPETPISAEQLAGAIAAFQRSLVAMNSPLDRFRAGDSTALTPQQQRGLQEFDDAGCDRCHRGRMFSNFNLHAEGVRENPQLFEPDEGARRFRFRTPSLRNVALTAPYMHNGMLATLEDVLRFFDNGRSENPNVVNRRQGDGDRGVAQLSRSFRRVEPSSRSGNSRRGLLRLEDLASATNRSGSHRTTDRSAHDPMDRIRRYFRESSIDGAHLGSRSGTESFAGISHPFLVTGESARGPDPRQRGK